jgi:hypothetical protein
MQGADGLRFLVAQSGVHPNRRLKPEDMNLEHLNRSEEKYEFIARIVQSRSLKLSPT